VATGAAIGLVTLPVLPIQTVDAIVGSVLGWAVPPMALTHDLHGMLGWEEHAAAVDRVYHSLPATDRDQATVLTGSHSQAAALNVLRREAVPRAVSGNMTYSLWDRTASAATRSRGRGTNLPAYVCREPLGTMVELWPELRRFGHAWPAAN
jgi:hypothetical protein